MPLPPLNMADAIRIPARIIGSPISHPTSGYRDWHGQVEAGKPVVALVLNMAGSQVSWARTSHRATAIMKTRILFAPYDSDGCSIQTCFSIMDATSYGRTCVESVMVHPEPRLTEFTTGQLVDIAAVPGQPTCELKALFLVRDDVMSARSGIWHLRGKLAAGLSEPWRTILTFGRTGEFTAG